MAVPIVLTGNLTIEGNDVADVVSSFKIIRSFNAVTIPATLANRREVTAAGAMTEQCEITFHSDVAAAGLWAELYDVIDTDDPVIEITGTVSGDTVGPDNPEFSFDCRLMSLDTGGEVGALMQQTITLPITADGISKSTSA